MRIFVISFISDPHPNPDPKVPDRTVSGSITLVTEKGWGRDKGEKRSEKNMGKLAVVTKNK
jgi:hypothetical protein